MSEAALSSIRKPEAKQRREGDYPQSGVNIRFIALAKPNQTAAFIAITPEYWSLASPSASNRCSGEPLDKYGARKIARNSARRPEQTLPSWTDLDGYWYSKNRNAGCTPSADRDYPA
jgi:hypothetical protein